MSNELEAVHVGRNQILQDQIGQGTRGRIERGAGIGHSLDRVALSLERAAQDLQRGGIVLNDKDPARAGHANGRHGGRVGFIGSPAGWVHPS